MLTTISQCTAARLAQTFVCR